MFIILTPGGIPWHRKEEDKLKSETILKLRAVYVHLGCAAFAPKNAKKHSWIELFRDQNINVDD